MVMQGSMTQVLGYDEIPPTLLHAVLVYWNQDSCTTALDSFRSIFSRTYAHGEMQWCAFPSTDTSARPEEEHVSGFTSQRKMWLIKARQASRVPCKPATPGAHSWVQHLLFTQIFGRFVQSDAEGGQVVLYKLNLSHNMLQCTEEFCWIPLVLDSDKHWWRNPSLYLEKRLRKQYKQNVHWKTKQQMTRQPGIVRRMK